MLTSSTQYFIFKSIGRFIYKSIGRFTFKSIGMLFLQSGILAILTKRIKIKIEPHLFRKFAI